MLKFCSAHIQLQTGHSDKKTLSQSVSPYPYSAPSNQSSFHQTHPQAIHIHNTQSVFIPSNTSTGNPHPQHATVFIPSNTSTGNPHPQQATVFIPSNTSTGNPHPQQQPNHLIPQNPHNKKCPQITQFNEFCVSEFS